MLCRECAELQLKSGHPEDTSEWNATKPSLHSRGGDAGPEQSHKEVLQEAWAQHLPGL